MTALYPSMVVHLRLRFDETVLAGEEQAGPSLSSAADLARRAAAGLVSVVPVQGSGRPDLLDGGDGLSHVYNLVPKSATVELPGYRQAGKFSLTIDYRDLPVDPRVIAACGVEVHLGAVRADDFARGMRGAQQGRRPASVLDTTDAAGGPREDTALLVGVADTRRVVHGVDGSEVYMAGRDLVGVFLDSPIDADTMSAVDLTRPIDDVVRQVLALHPLGNRVVVEVQDGDWSDRGGVPSPGTRDGLTRVRRGASGRGARNAPRGDASKLSFWDLIVQWCGLVGAVPYFVGQRLRVRPAKSLFDAAKPFDPRRPTPFRGGLPRQVQGETEPLQVRRLVYGREIEEISFERSDQGVGARTVEVVSVDTSSRERGLGRLLVARWPDKDGEQRAQRTGRGGDRVRDAQRALEDAERAWRSTTPGTADSAAKMRDLAAAQGVLDAARAGSRPARSASASVAPSGRDASEEVLRISVPGVRDLEALREVAKNLFEEIARGELGGTCETRALFSFGGDQDDPDMLRIRPGDQVEFLVDRRALSSRSPVVAELVEHERRPFGEEVAEVRRRLGTGGRLGDEGLARAIVASSRSMSFRLMRFFRVGGVKFDWRAGDASGGGGVRVAFDFQNYVVAQRDATTRRGDPNLGAPRAAAGSRR